MPRSCLPPAADRRRDRTGRSAWAFLPGRHCETPGSGPPMAHRPRPADIGSPAWPGPSVPWRRRSSRPPLSGRCRGVPRGRERGTPPGGHRRPAIGEGASNSSSIAMALFQRPRGVVTVSEGAGSVHGMRACRSRLGPGSRFPDAPSNSRGVLRISPFTRIVGFAPPFNGPDGKWPDERSAGPEAAACSCRADSSASAIRSRTTACLDRSSGRRSDDRFHERRRGPRADPPPAARSVAAPPPVDDVLHRPINEYE